ncbi:MAG: serine/threonine-protein kinase [Pirellulales bacterium]
MHQSLGDSSRLPVPDQESDLFWDQIAAVIDRLVLAWEGDFGRTDLPDLAPLLDGFTLAERPSVLVELIKVDLEMRWQGNGALRKLEWYVEQFPQDLSIDDLPSDLIFEELQIRMQAGNTVAPSEIRRRFPRQASALEQLLGTVALPGTPTESFHSTSPDGRDVAGKGVSRGSHAPRRSHVKYEAGDSVDDFDLLLPLGEGSFAQVFLARQRSLERLVALKISSDEGSEPRTLAQLDHPNLVRVFDQRCCGDPPVRLLYMELVPGGTLLDVVRELADSPDEAARGQRSVEAVTKPGSRHRFRKNRPPNETFGTTLLEGIDQRLAACGTAPPSGSPLRRVLSESSRADSVCHLGARLADGLAYAHQRGILHRDIKPANVLLAADATPKLADFNISFNAASQSERPEDAFGGSLAYMSPEQIAACHPLLEGSPQLVREASDIYSLGIVLFELLAGRRPFDDPHGQSNRTAAMQRMIDERSRADVDRIGSLLPADSPDSLAQVLARCLDPEPLRRYRSASQLAQALRLCLHPRCWALLEGPCHLAGDTVLRFPLTTALTVTLIPNILAALFNLVYNYRAIIDNLTPEAQKLFWTTQTWINAIAFPVGIAICVGFTRSRLRGLRGTRKSPRASSHRQEANRQDDGFRAARPAPLPEEPLPEEPLPEEPPPGGGGVLLLGRCIALVALTLWVVSGIAYPVSMNLGLREGVTADIYVHFAGSLALCGLLAATYPYFLVTFVSVRWLFPAFIRGGIYSAPCQRDLDTVRMLNGLFTVLSALVPLLSILLIVLLRNEQRSEQQWALIVMSATGLIGFGGVFLLQRVIDQDLRALEVLLPGHAVENAS